MYLLLWLLLLLLLLIILAVVVVVVVAVVVVVVFAASAVCALVQVEHVTLEGHCGCEEARNSSCTYHILGYPTVSHCSSISSLLVLLPLSLSSPACFPPFDSSYSSS